MPEGTNYVVIKVREESDQGDVNKVMITGDGKEAKATITWNLGENRAVIGPLPAVRVIVRAEAWGGIHYLSQLVEPVDKLVRINPGINNPFDLALGDYNITAVATDQTLTLVPQSKITANGTSDLTPGPSVSPTEEEPTPTPYDDFPYPPDDTPVPTPVTGGEASTSIIARLMIVYPAPDPNTSSDPNAVVTPAPSPKPIANKLIKFRLAEGTVGTGTLPATGYTDPNGFCVVTFGTDNPGRKVIEASYQPDPNELNSIYKATCEVNVEQGEINPDKYTLDAIISRGQIVQFDGQTIIKVCLTSKTGADVSGKTVNFSINQGGIGSLSAGSATTDPNGMCQTIFSSGTTGTATITARYIVDNLPITSDATIEVVEQLACQDDFESEFFGLDHNSPIWSRYDLNNWIIIGPIIGYNLLDPGVNASIDFNTKSLRIYGSSIESRKTLEAPYECSAKFRVSSEYLPSERSDVGGITINHYPGYTFLIRYKSDGTLTDLNDEPLGNYRIDDWNTVDIKFAKNTIRYLINDELVKIVTPHSGTPTYDKDYLQLSSQRYIDIWYDDIKVYRLWGVPGFED